MGVILGGDFNTNILIWGDSKLVKNDYPCYTPLHNLLDINSTYVISGVIIDKDTNNITTINDTDPKNREIISEEQKSTFFSGLRRTKILDYFFHKNIKIRDNCTYIYPENSSDHFPIFMDIMP